MSWINSINTIRIMMMNKNYAQDNVYELDQFHQYYSDYDDE